MTRIKKNRQTVKADNFWTDLKSAGRPIFALAPMAGWTDSPFRQVCKSFGADIVYSEMASAAALTFQPENTLRLLASAPRERPYVVQLFGAQPQHFQAAIALIIRHGLPAAVSGRGSRSHRRLPPDGFDINFGCPVRKVVKQGAGAVLMDNKKIAREIVKAVCASTDRPVSIKIRARVGRTDALVFLDYLSDLPLVAVMIHGRTMSQGHNGPVDLEMVRSARNCFPGVILANGGILDLAGANAALRQSRADGLGIARGALGRPWFFQELKSQKEIHLSWPEKAAVMLEQARLASANGESGSLEIRKHLCAYCRGERTAGKIRANLMACSDWPALLKAIKNSKHLLAARI